MRLLEESENVSKALKIATRAHRGQLDKAGEPYINHPKAVARMLGTEETQTVALLHDVVEDTAVTLGNLKDAGFSDDIITAVDCLSQREGERREEYIMRVAKNPLATMVKLADLKHNQDLSRIKSLGEKDFERVARYRAEEAFLKKAQEERGR
jgi:(p)ppGpp synthase/HD superfamily hydrolase